MPYVIFLQKIGLFPWS